MFDVIATLLLALSWIGFGFGAWLVLSGAVALVLSFDPSDPRMLIPGSRWPLGLALLVIAAGLGLFLTGAIGIVGFVL